MGAVALGLGSAYFNGFNSEDAVNSIVHLIVPSLQRNISNKMLIAIKKKSEAVVFRLLYSGFHY